MVWFVISLLFLAVVGLAFLAVVALAGLSDLDRAVRGHGERLDSESRRIDELDAAVRLNNGVIHERVSTLAGFVEDLDASTRDLLKRADSRLDQVESWQVRCDAARPVARVATLEDQLTNLGRNHTALALAQLRASQEIRAAVEGDPSPGGDL